MKVLLIAAVIFSTSAFSADVSDYFQTRDVIFQNNKVEFKDSSKYNIEEGKDGYTTYEKADGTYRVVVQRDSNKNIVKIIESDLRPISTGEAIGSFFGYFPQYTKKGHITVINPKGELLSKTNCKVKAGSSSRTQCSSLTFNLCKNALKYEAKLAEILDQKNKCADWEDKLSGFLSDKTDYETITKNRKELKEHIGGHKVRNLAPPKKSQKRLSQLVQSLSSIAEQCKSNIQYFPEPTEAAARGSAEEKSSGVTEEKS